MFEPSWQKNQQSKIKTDFSELKQGPPLTVEKINLFSGLEQRLRQTVEKISLFSGLEQQLRQTVETISLFSGVEQRPPLTVEQLEYFTIVADFQNFLFLIAFHFIASHSFSCQTSVTNFDFKQVVVFWLPKGFEAFKSYRK